MICFFRAELVSGVKLGFWDKLVSGDKLAFEGDLFFWG